MASLLLLNFYSLTQLNKKIEISIEEDYVKVFLKKFNDKYKKINESLESKTFKEFQDSFLKEYSFYEANIFKTYLKLNKDKIYKKYKENMFKEEELKDLSIIKFFKKFELNYSQFIEEQILYCAQQYSIEKLFYMDYILNLMNISSNEKEKEINHFVKKIMIKHLKHVNLFTENDLTKYKVFMNFIPEAYINKFSQLEISKISYQNKLLILNNSNLISLEYFNKILNSLEIKTSKELIDIIKIIVKSNYYNVYEKIVKEVLMKINKNPSTIWLEILNEVINSSNEKGNLLSIGKLFKI